MPVRDVQCADAIPWMQARGRMAGVCAVTSLPDVSEVNLSLAAWREWFLNAVQLVIASVPDESAALFFQSDIKRDGAWIDKGAMVIRAAEDAGAGAVGMAGVGATAEGSCLSSVGVKFQPNQSDERFQSLLASALT